VPSCGKASPYEASYSANLPNSVLTSIIRPERGSLKGGSSARKISLTDLKTLRKLSFAFWKGRISES
jgi:hypothetical protein